MFGGFEPLRDRLGKKFTSFLHPHFYALILQLHWLLEIGSREEQPPGFVVLSDFKESPSSKGVKGLAKISRRFLIKIDIFVEEILKEAKSMSRRCRILVKFL